MPKRAGTAPAEPSPRAPRPVLVADCASLTEALFESELFGHECCAFTGAVSARPGLVESASVCTLFLDEVGDFFCPCRWSCCTCCEAAPTAAWAAPNCGAAVGDRYFGRRWRRDRGRGAAADPGCGAASRRSTRAELDQPLGISLCTLHPAPCTLHSAPALARAVCLCGLRADQQPARGAAGSQVQRSLPSRSCRPPSRCLSSASCSGLLGRRARSSCSKKHSVMRT